MVTTRRPGDRPRSVVDLFPTKHLAAPGGAGACPNRRRASGRSSGRGSSPRASGWRAASSSSTPTSPRRSDWSSCGPRSSGSATQYFLNMEIERYTLATGETALTGFSRYWRHWGLVFAILAYFANIWPGWVTSSATLVTYLVGGSVVPIAIGMLLVIGITLTMAPVVYQALEKIEFFKVAAVLLLIIVASLFAISADAWADAPQIVTESGHPVRGARVRAAAGGAGLRRRRRRAEPLPEQLDPRQALRHGRLRPADRQPGDRPPRGRAVDRLRVRADAREPRAVAALVALREHRAADDLRDHQLPDASCSPRCWPTPRSSGRRGSPATSPSSRSRATR